MFSRWCVCCPASFAAPMDHDGGERSYDIGADSHQDWCPAADSSVQQKLSSESTERAQLPGQVAPSLARCTREELESLVQEQLQQRMRENHRTNQLREKIDQTEEVLIKYCRRLDALQKHINGLSVVTQSYASQPDKPPVKLTRHVGLQARVKPPQIEASGEIKIDRATHSEESIKDDEAEGGSKTCDASLDAERPALSGERDSIDENLERNRSSSPESTLKITPCSVVLTRCPQLDAYAQSLADETPSETVTNKAPAIEVDLTLSDDEEAHRLATHSASHPPKESLRSPVERGDGPVNERSVTDEADPPEVKRRKTCDFPQPTEASSTFATPVTETSLQPRIPVIISVTSIVTATTSTWPSKIAQTYKPRSPQIGPNALYHHWKLNEGVMTPPKPSVVASARFNSSVNSGILLDLTTKYKERKPVLIIPNPRLPQPVRPAAQHQDRLAVSISPKVIIAQAASRGSAPVAPLYSPSRHGRCDSGSTEGPGARAVPQVNSLINNSSVCNVRPQLAMTDYNSQAPMVLNDNIPEKGLSHDLSQASAFHRVFPSSYDQRSVPPPMIRPPLNYPRHPGPNFAVPTALRPYRIAPPARSIDSSPLRPQLFPCSSAITRHRDTISQFKALARSAETLNETVVQIPSPSPKKATGVKRALPDLMPINAVPIRHPPPLPAHLKTQQLHTSQLFKPVLAIQRLADGIELKWTIPQLARNQLDEVTHYEVYCYQEIPSVAPSAELWKQVGSIRALALPMGCALSKFAKGFRYHFAVRAMLRHASAQRSNASPFSEFAVVLYD